MRLHKLGPVALVAGVVAAPLPAQSLADPDLRAIIARQAREIDALNARVDALEKGRAEPAEAAPRPADMSASPNKSPDIQQAGAASPPAASPAKAAPVLVDWHAGGPTLHSADGRFTFHPRGRVLADISSTSGSNDHARNIAGTEFRNVRLGGEGSVGHFPYKIEIDVAGNNVRLRDAFVGWETKVAGRDVAAYLGNKLNDRSIDGASSLTAIPFAERNAVANLIVPQVGIYGLGLFAGIVGDNGHVSINIKGEDAGSNDGSRDDSVVYMARAHIAPVRGDAGFVHLGAWAYHEHLNDSVDRFTGGDVEGSDFDQNLAVNPGTIDRPSSDNGFGFEAGGVLHTVWALGEYGERHIRRADAPNVIQKAWSISTGWFLSGETPPFSASTGQWSRPRLRRPVTDGGAGGFELLARYDRTNLADAPLGGKGRYLTLGGNWYVTDWADIKLNWVRFRVDDPAGDFAGTDTGSIFVLRGEVSF